MGLYSAYYLNKEGYEVTILEKESKPSGASPGNAGMIVPSHFMPMASPGMISKGFRWMFDKESPFYIQPKPSLDLLSWGWKFYKAARHEKFLERAKILSDLNKESRVLHEEVIVSEMLRVGFQTKGLISFCKTKAVFKEEIETAEQANRLGIEARVLSVEEARNLNPGLELDIAGGIYYPGDAFLTPNNLIDQLRNLLETRGVNFEFNRGVKKINTKGRRILEVQTERETYSADHYLICAGAWSSVLAGSIGITLTMQAGKGYSFTLPNPTVMPETCSILTEARVAVTPMLHGLRFAGTMEMAGLDESITRSRIQGIMKAVPSFFPQFSGEEFKGLELWAGLRPCSPDGLPYVGRTGHYDNLSFATGHAMLGLSLGAVTGKMVTRELTSNFPVHPFLNPDRT